MCTPVLKNMKTKHKIKLLQESWTCGDGCCSEYWTLVFVDGVAVEEKFVNEFGSFSTTQFDDNQALVAAIRYLCLDYPFDEVGDPEAWLRETHPEIKIERK